MKNLLLATLLILLFSNMQCDKSTTPPEPEPELTLPPITTQGLNTVGCKIDGKVWVPYSKTPVPRMNIVVNTRDNWYCSFAGRQHDNSSYSRNTIEFNISPLNTDTFFILGKNRKGNIGFFLPIDTIGSSGYLTDENLNNGYVHIHKFDSINQIISGTFAFSVINSVSKIKHEITEGRFDLRFSY
jgi:hypothetical protein